MKIYISSKFKEFGYKLRPFDIYHPKMNTVNNFKKQMLQKSKEARYKREEETKDEDKDRLSL
jgi:hypothetical protein